MSHVSSLNDSLILVCVACYARQNGTTTEEACLLVRWWAEI